MMRYLLCLTILVVIGRLSCISPPVSRELLGRVLSFLPLSDSTHGFLIAHYKVGHSVFYGLLTWALFFSLEKRRYLLAPVAAFLFGLTMEMVQSFLPARTSTWTDLGYNLAGIGVVMVLLRT